MDIPRVLAILCATFAAALLLGGSLASAPGLGTSASATLHNIASLGDGLIVARADLATRAGVDPAAARLVTVRATQWDGCLGLPHPRHACAAIAVPGLIADFQVAGRHYRYHITPTHMAGPVDADAADGTPPATAAPSFDVEAALNAYLRADIALHRNLALRDVVVDALLPSNCGPDASPAAPDCRDEDSTRLYITATGALLVSDIARDGSVYRLQTVAPAPSPPDSPAVALQQRVRNDLAVRLAIPPDTVSVASYRTVRWPDACLGINQPGQVCAQVVTPGFAITLSVSSSDDAHERTAAYHGSGTHFVLVSLTTTSR